MSKNTRTRILLTAVAALLLVAMTVAGTIAYLTDVTDSVTNSFTSADIHIDLTETMNTDTNNDKVNDTWTMQMIPGTSKAKDPTVHVDDDLTSVNIYVYVKVEVADAIKDVLTYSVDGNWKALGDAYPNIYYREWTDGSGDVSWPVLTDSTVSVSKDLTADDVYAAEGNIVITAYAIQQEGFADAATAWTTGKLAAMTTANDGNLDVTDNGKEHAADHNNSVTEPTGN